MRFLSRGGKKLFISIEKCFYGSLEEHYIAKDNFLRASKDSRVKIKIFLGRIITCGFFFETHSARLHSTFVNVDQLLHKRFSCFHICIYVTSIIRRYPFNLPSINFHYGTLFALLMMDLISRIKINIPFMSFDE